MCDKRRDTERKFLLEFIETYKSLPALWKIKSDEYSNRDKKAETYKVLLHKYNEQFPTATLEDMKKKLNALRTNFRSEVRKMERSAKSGAGTKGLYVPSIWYFEALQFLREQDTTAPSRSTVMVKEESWEDEGEQTQHTTTQAWESVEFDELVPKLGYTGSTQKSQYQQSSTSRADSNASISPTHSSAASKKRRVEAKKDELTSLAKTRFLQESSEDEYDNQAKTWANELRKMDPSQQLYAKKAINDVLFEGRCGTLTRNPINFNSI